MLIVAIGVAATFFTSIPAPPDIKPFARFISHEFHSTYLALGIIALLFLAFREKSRQAAWLVVMVIGVESLIYITIREALWSGFHLAPRPSGGSGGFPSGHTACHCALAYLLTERFPRVSPVFYAVASAIGWSRVADGGHYPYQVLAGAILGFAVAILITPRFQKPRKAAYAE